MWKGNQTCLGEGVRNLKGKKYSEPSLRPQGGSRVFKLGVTVNRNSSSQGKTTVGCGAYDRSQIGKLLIYLALFYKFGPLALANCQLLMAKCCIVHMHPKNSKTFGLFAIQCGRARHIY
ncbi:MAG TPA: hypothetical protein VI685_10795 [Candidatus Angelobacter sp.]